ncbi:hypothetical protein ES708_32415 [subsurface metagenome]
MGPAIELGIYHHKTFENLLSFYRNIPIIQSDLMYDDFSTQAFPSEFYLIFGKSNDYIHKGLVDSFKYTIPNTLNRIVRISNIASNVSDYFNRLDCIGAFRTTNTRYITYLLKVLLHDEPFFHTELLKKNDSIIILAKCNNTQKLNLLRVVKTINELLNKNEIEYYNLPKALKDDINSKLNDFDIERFVFYQGLPVFPLRNEKKYIPIDFLPRQDASKLTEIICNG